MDLQQLMQELNNISTIVFKYQLQKDLSLTELGIIYRRLLKLKETFLAINFLDLDLDINEIEQARFYMLEEIAMIKIFIKEKVEQDTKVEEDNLKRVYKGNILADIEKEVVML